MLQRNIPPGWLAEVNLHSPAEIGEKPSVSRQDRLHSLIAFIIPLHGWRISEQRDEKELLNGTLSSVHPQSRAFLDPGLLEAGVFVVRSPKHLDNQTNQTEPRVGV
jgi:hypothetical protein